MKKYLPFLILIFLVSLIAVSTYKINNKQVDAENLENQNSKEDSSPHFIKTKISLPDFSLPDLFKENEILSKKTFQKKYSLVNFFASWCTTCRAEHDILLRLKSEGIIDIYGIAFRDIDENTKKFLDQHGNPYTQVAKDSKGLFSKIINLNAVPETLIIDQNGDVVMRYRGNLQESSLDEIESFCN